MKMEKLSQKAIDRKNNKPIMEKKRRARINHCLNQLKSLILETNSERLRHSKLEKADILEMTVRYLQTLRTYHLLSGAGYPSAAAAATMHPHASAIAAAAAAAASVAAAAHAANSTGSPVSHLSPQISPVSSSASSTISSSDCRNVLDFDSPPSTCNSQPTNLSLAASRHAANLSNPLRPLELTQNTNRQRHANHHLNQFSNAHHHHNRHHLNQQLSLNLSTNHLHLGHQSTSPSSTWRPW